MKKITGIPAITAQPSSRPSRRALRAPLRAIGPTLLTFIRTDHPEEARSAVSKGGTTIAGIAEKIMLFVFVTIFPSFVLAAGGLGALINKVTLQLSAEQWVTTKTALVDVGVNAAVSNQGIEKVQNDVMQKLSQLSNQGEWHILSFNRSLDKSGLENIQIKAQARLPQTELGSLRDKTKAISKPGETLTIDNVQFTPSNDEVRQANSQLRNNIYQQAYTEIGVLNKIFTNQQYYLYNIDFVPQHPPMPVPMMNGFGAKVMAANVAPLKVGNKVELQATVILASLPDALTQRALPR